MRTPRLHERDKSHSYYTLAQLDGGTWSPQFGDYDRDVVADELADYVDSGVRRQALRIVKSGDTQAEIDAAIAQLNKGGLR